MQPGGLSSLIFVVIIGVWAAYFIQYWVRRREHLATARSVDQFSESMRILERRDPQPAAGRPEQGGQTSAHAAYGQILLNRAASARVAEAAAGTADRPAMAGQVGRTEPAGRPSTASARRTRGLVVLGAFSTAVVAGPLVALAVLPPWTLVVPLVSIGACFAWLRSSVRSEQRRRRAAGQARRHQADESARRAAGQQVRRTAERARVEQPARRDETPGAPGSVDPAAPRKSDPATRGEEAAEAIVRAPRRSELYDVQAVEAASTQADRDVAPVAAAPVEPTLPARPLVDEDDIPLTWDPVPVPRPTYTMKARVTRPAPTSADLVGDADTEYAPVEDELPARRAAGA